MGLLKINKARLKNMKVAKSAGFLLLIFLLSGTFALAKNINLGATGDSIVTPGPSIYSNRINAGYASTGDATDLWINYEGYQNSTAYFRDFRIGNGKQGNAILFVDGSERTFNIDGNVGIGTTAPFGGLNVVWGTNASNPIYATNNSATYGTLSLNNAATGGTGVYSVADKNYFSGNVGIGTTGPTRKLDVAVNVDHSTSGLTSQLTVRGTGNSTEKLNIGYDTTGKYGFLEAVNESVVWQNLSLQPSGGNVGIGTTVPSASLHVYGNTTGGNFGTYLQNNGGGSGLKIYNADWDIADYLIYATNGGSYSFVVNGNGNVGIGTLTPTNKLHVNAGTGQAMTVAGGQIGGLNSVPLNADQAVPLGYLQANYTPSGGAVLWSGTVNSTIYNGTTGAGNVGIGTTVPGAALHVVGNSSAVYGSYGYVSQIIENSSNYPALLFKHATLGTLMRQEPSGDFTLENGATNGSFAERLRIMAGGSIGIGTTAPEGKLHVFSAAGGDRWPFVMSSTGINTSGFWTTSESFNLLLRDASGNLNVRLRPDGISYFTGGNVGIGTTAPATKLVVSNAGSANIFSVEQTTTTGDLYAQMEIKSGSRSGYLWMMNESATSYGGNGALNIYAATGPMLLYTAATERVRILANGYVGIGTTADAGTDYSSNRLFMTGEIHMASQGAHVWFGDSTIANPIGIGEGLVNSVGADQDFMSLYYRNSLRLFSNSATERVRIDVNGNVGIGIAAPTNLLHVNAGTGQAMTVAGGQIGGLNSVPLNADQAVPLGYLQSNYASSLWRGTLNGTIYNGTTGAGNVGIGTTNPSTKLHALGGNGSNLPAGYGTVGNYTMILQDPTSSAIDVGGSINFAGYKTGTSATGLFSYIKGGKYNSTAGDERGYLSMGVSYNSGGSGMEVMRLNTDGNVGIGTTNPGYKFEVDRTPTGIEQPIAGFQGNGAYDGIVGILQTAATGDPVLAFHSGSYVAHIGVDKSDDHKLEFTTGAPNWNNIGNATYVRMTLDRSGNVGIGTTNPVAKLHVIGGANTLIVDGAAPTSAYGALLISQTNGGFGLYDQSAKSYLAGNVGIGSTNPSYKFVVNGNIANWLSVSSNAANGSEFDFAHGGGYGAYISAGTNSSASTYALDVVGSGGNYLYVRGDGNVGIGTTAPATTLDVNGTIKVGPSSVGTDSIAGIYFSSAINSTADYSIHRTTGSWSGPNYQQLLLDWDTGIVIDGGSLYGKSGTIIQPNGGNVGVGTTASTNKLQIGAGGAGYGGNDFVIGNGTQVMAIDANISGSTTFYTNTNYNFMNSGAGSTGNVGIGMSPSYKLDVNGDVRATSFIYSSDARLKTNISTIQSPLEKILQLRGVTFNWKKDNTPSVGLIAQEVEKVFPELVTTNGEYKGVQYGNLVAPLIEAVKEQQKQIEELKAGQKDYDLLKARVKKLETRSYKK